MGRQRFVSGRHFSISQPQEVNFSHYPNWILANSQMEKFKFYSGILDEIENNTFYLIVI